MRKLKRSNTCIAVIRDKAKKGDKTGGELVFAADRRISWGMDHQQIAVNPKVVKRNGVILAGAGSGYICDIACSLVPIPDMSPKTTPFLYVHQVLRESLVSTLIANGCKDEQGNLALAKGQSALILVGIKGELFEMNIHPDIGVSIDCINAPFACGCGGAYALGSLKTTERLSMGVEDRLKIALVVASDISPGCDSNVDIVRESSSDSDEG